jgi:hypothetical protein
LIGLGVSTTPLPCARLATPPTLAQAQLVPFQRMTWPVEQVSGSSASPKRRMNAAIWSRRTFCSGQYSRCVALIDAQPSVTPRCAIQVMSVQNGWLDGTSVKTHGDSPGQNCAEAPELANASKTHPVFTALSTAASDCEFLQWETETAAQSRHALSQRVLALRSLAGGAVVRVSTAVRQRRGFAEAT